MCSLYATILTELFIFIESALSHVLMCETFLNLLIVMVLLPKFNKLIYLYLTILTKYLENSTYFRL